MSLILFRIIVAASLAAAVGFVAPGRALAENEPVQITDDDGTTGCTSIAPVPDGAAESFAWQSDCDPAGTNADGSVEIFRADAGEAPEQLTSGEGCTSSHPTISDDGNRIAFTSDCNLTGANLDGNVEIFLWRSGSVPAITQLTISQGCDNLEPEISGGGGFVAYDSTCNLAGFNNGGRGSEIFRVTAAGVIKQMTNDPNGGQCDSTSPSITDNGSMIAFDSDCDLTGDNEDLAIQIYTVTGGGVDTGTVRQRTAGDEECSSMRPSIDGDGAIIAYYGDCNPVGFNPDRSEEIFTVTVSQSPDTSQVTRSDDGPECSSMEPLVSTDGNAVVFTSFCELRGQNDDGSIEVFHAGIGSSASAVFAVTDGDDDCASVAGGISADGTVAAFDSDCDPAGDNPDGSVEAFRVSTCACGSPATRDRVPKASDALFALRTAVGISTCSPCECDVDDSGSTTASDALRILSAAVGKNVALTCPVP